MSPADLRDLGHDFMVRHHNLALGAPGPGTEAWVQCLRTVTELLRRMAVEHGTATMRQFAAGLHESTRWTLAATLRQLDLNLRRKAPSALELVADALMIGACPPPGPGVPLPGSAAYEATRRRVVEVLEAGKAEEGNPPLLVVCLNDAAIEAVRRMLRDADAEARAGVVEAAQRAAAAAAWGIDR